MSGPMLAAMLSLTLLLVQPNAQAEIFKCTGERGLPTYQNFPCEFDSLGAAPAAPAMAHAPAPANAPSTAARTADKALPAVPRVGMMAADVRKIWGDPINSSKEEHAKSDIEIWSYANARAVEFDRRGRVTAIRW